MAQPGELFNRQELLRAIWGDSAYRDPRGDRRPRPPPAREARGRRPAEPELLLTVRGAGYRLHAAREPVPSGLRARLTAALLAVSVLTLAVAAVRCCSRSTSGCATTR